MCCHFLGQALEKAGGKDFRKEIDDLSKEHGNLDTAGGKGAYIDSKSSLMQNCTNYSLSEVIVSFPFGDFLWK